MKLSYHTGSRILSVALLAGIWSVACSSDKTDTGGTADTTGGATVASSSTGGAKATGGTSAKATGGAATGGAATGGAATGGAATGGAATGGAATGGAPAGTGGAATGGVTSTGTSTTAGGAATGGVTGTGTSTTAGGAATGGTTSTSTSTSCPIVWDWEGTTADSWAHGDTETDVTLGVSTTQTVTGTQSLKATIPALTSAANPDGGAGGTSMTRTIQIAPAATANLLPGATITAHIWVPADAGGTTPATKTWVQMFMQSNSWANWDQSATVKATANGWTTLTLTVPAASKILPGGINKLGLQIGVSNGDTFAGGDIFIDSITVCGGTMTCTGTSTGSFDFETATGGWAASGTNADTVVALATDQHYGTTGTGSLKSAMTATPVATATAWTSRAIQLSNPQVYCGQTITYHIYADNVTNLDVQPYASINGWAYSAGTSVTLVANTWIDVTYQVPATVGFLGIQAIGLNIQNKSTTATFTGNVWVDQITW